MEQLAELLFELSNQDRLQILHELIEQNLKLTQIAKNLDITAQETSRHLTRLSKAQLMEKTPDGSYSLTEYGRSILKMLPGYIFLLKNRDYFTTHTLNGLPQGFAARIGELKGSKAVDNTIVLFQLVDTLIAKSEELIWIMSDQALASTFSHLIDAMKRGVKFRTIMPEGLGAPELPSDILPDFSQYREGLMDNRHSNSIEIVVILSEQAGIVSFKSVDGKMDYTGFQTMTKEGIRWCRDIFSFYWEKGAPLSEEEWKSNHPEDS